MPKRRRERESVIAAAERPGRPGERGAGRRAAPTADPEGTRSGGAQKARGAVQVGDLQELGLWRRAQRESRQHRGSRIRGPAREGGETPGTPGPGVRHGASGAEHGECGGGGGRSREPAGGRQGRAVGPRTGRNWWEWGFLFLVLASCLWQVPGFAQVVIDNQWLM